MDDQPNRINKMALCVASCTLAKDNLVAEKGIGEDLPFTIFGWEGDRLAVICQLDTALMDSDPEERLARADICFQILRRGWNVTGITFVAEGYCSSEFEKTRNHDLSVLFAQPDSVVDECLTFTHVEDGSPTLVVAPYRQTVGRKVEWDETMLVKDIAMLRQSAYPSVMADALQEEPHAIPEDSDEYFEILISGLERYGFSVQMTF